MSFKREGDDSGLLANLRRRRIKELFAEDIPEDEAKLLCNGRFACLVCSHNPIFDTVNMLAVHRQGKKHAAGEAEFVRKKKELRALVLKRKHEQYMKDGTTNIRQAVSTSSGGISSLQPYDPRVKKHKLKPHDRKPCLDLLHSESDAQHSSVVNSAASAKAFSVAIPSKHSHQLKNIFQSSQKQQGPVLPYISHRKTSFRGDLPQPLSGDGHSQSSLSANTHTVAVGQSCSLPSAPVPSASSGVTCDGLKGSNSCKSNGAVVSLDVGNAGHSQFSHGHQTDSVQHAGGSRGLSVTCIRQNDCERTGQGVNGVQNTSTAGSNQCSGDSEKKKLAQKYHQLSGSGWKKDWDGKWIRDEDAEFDSDEEPPDLP